MRERIPINEMLRGAADVTPLSHQYERIRRKTEELCLPLALEDYGIQSMPDASPVKWHLAHTSWFFENFAIAGADPNYEPYDLHYLYLFNSYYVTVGNRQERAKRGLISRPTVREVYNYREHIDRKMAELFKRGGPKIEELHFKIALALHHEQQHQELLLTDLKHAFSQNPLHPFYVTSDALSLDRVVPLKPREWISIPEGLYRVGHDGEGFAFDHELPRHCCYLHGFQIASRLVTNAEYLEFLEEGGYQRPELWLSDGWIALEKELWTAPLYWFKKDGHWQVFTLHGLKKINLTEPVCHLSYFEADAYARWKGARLPTEAEWEIASEMVPVEGLFLESHQYHPVMSETAETPLQNMFGNVWQWTVSPFTPYPGFVPLSGALGEYNGKFMCNQFVLRGGSCVTPENHIRRTYRNFFPPSARWQFSGIRLAQDEGVIR